MLVWHDAAVANNAVRARFGRLRSYNFSLICAFCLKGNARNLSP